MTRSALPQNYVLSNSILIDDFSVTANWTPMGTSAPSLSENLAHVLTGEKSMTVTATAPTATFGIMKSISLPLGLNAFDVIFWLDTTADIRSIECYVTSDVTFAHYVMRSLPAVNLHQGWNRFTINYWTGDDPEASTKLRLRFSILPVSGHTPAITFDSCWYGGERIPTCVLMFDDSDPSIYSEAFAYMETKGIKGTWFVNPASVGGDGLVTLEQLQEMYAAGWDIANHTYSHTRLPDYALSAQQAHIQTATDWLVANGMPRAAYHFAYPYGDYNDDTIAAMQNVGILTARTTNIGFWWHSSVDYGDKYLLPVGHSFTMSDDESAYRKTFLSQVQGSVDRGSTMFTMLHIVKETPSTSLETSREFFRFAIDTLVAKNIRIITISEWYNGLTNPRYRSLPLGRS